MSEEDNSSNLTEQAYKMLADDFQEQFSNKERELEKCKEKLLKTSKGVVVAYSILRILDNYIENMEIDKEDDILMWIKSTIEIGREELSREFEETIIDF